NWILHLRDPINLRGNTAWLGPQDIRTVGVPRTGPELETALETMGFNRGTNNSLVYIVRDNRTGQVLKVGETSDPFGRFPEYLKQANTEGPSVSIDIFPMERYARVGVEGRKARIQIESSVRRGLSGEGHTLPWDDSRTGWAPGTGPRPAG